MTSFFQMDSIRPANKPLRVVPDRQLAKAVAPAKPRRILATASPASPKAKGFALDLGDGKAEDGRFSRY
jgi:hypothetical protein